jgi:hypothetical protein
MVMSSRSRRRRNGLGGWQALRTLGLSLKHFRAPLNLVCGLFRYSTLCARLSELRVGSGFICAGSRHILLTVTDSSICEAQLVARAIELIGCVLACARLLSLLDQRLRARDFGRGLSGRATCT